MEWLASVRPVDQDGIIHWLVAIMFVYLFIKEFWLTESSKRFQEGFGHISDAGTFSQSVIILYGIFDKQVMAAIGDFKLFLAMAGLAGLRYSVMMLFK